MHAHLRRYVDDALSDALLTRKVPAGSTLSLDYDADAGRVIVNDFIESAVTTVARWAMCDGRFVLIIAG